MFYTNLLRVKLVAICYLLCLLYPATSLAQNKVDTTNVHALGNVTIEASKPRFGLISPLPVQTLAGKDLERLNSLSVADAIRYFSGIQLKDYGGIGGLKTINVRSLGSEHVIVFYDGIPLGNAQNGQVDLGKYSLDNIDEIQLYNGQKSTIFQPARGFFSSSSLYLRTKAPQFENESFHAKASYKTGSFGLINPSISWQQKLNKNLSLTSSVEWTKADGGYKFRFAGNEYDTIVKRQNSDVENIRIEGALYGKLKKGTWNAKAYFFDSERGLPGAITSNVFEHHQRQWDWNIFVQGNLELKLNSKYKLMANMKAAQDYTRYTDPTYPIGEGRALNNKYTQNEYYLSAVNLYHLKEWWDISLATDLTLNTLDANLNNFAEPSRTSTLAALSSSLRFSQFDLQATLLGSTISNRAKINQESNDVNKISPSISGSYQPFATKDLRIRAFYKQSLRVPTFNDMYYVEIGNASLRPEYTAQYDFGSTWLIPISGFVNSLSVQADVYYNRVTDMIIAVPSANLFRWSMTNLAKVEVKGLDANAAIALSLPHSIKMNMGLGYTYQNTLDKTPKSTANNNQIPYTPKHSASATASANWNEWQLNYSYLYASKRYRLPENIERNYMPPWYTSDISLSWQHQWNKKEVRIGGEINNLFNQYRDVIINFPMPGRSFRFNLSLSI